MINTIRYSCSRLLLSSNLPYIIVLVGMMVFSPANSGVIDSKLVWPLCGRIAEAPPSNWAPSDGCPKKRAGNANYSDAPFSATFGPRWLVSAANRYDFHRGLDIPAPTGTPVFAVTDGEVRLAGTHSAYSDALVQIRHFRPGEQSCVPNGCYHSQYMHLSDWVVSPGEWVSRGQLVGYTGLSSSGFTHLHFEIRDAPADDVYSSWQRDAIHPLSALPYTESNNAIVSVESVESSDPNNQIARVRLISPRYDFLRLEVTVYDEFDNEIPQPGNTANENGYHILPAFLDLNEMNAAYTHKDSSSVPWWSFGEGGVRECPYHSDHDMAYDPHVHLDAQDPYDYQIGWFNGQRIFTGKYWPGDYELEVEFQNLQGPIACLKAKATFASGYSADTQWGKCDSGGGQCRGRGCR